jgi:hypothetical protein
VAEVKIETSRKGPDQGTGDDKGDQHAVVINLGKQRRKSVKRLVRGKGKLLGEVLDAVDELRQAGTISADAPPVVVVVERKRAKLKSWFR